MIINYVLDTSLGYWWIKKNFFQQVQYSCEIYLDSYLKESNILQEH